MGWRLVEEILGHCPDIKYREFRVLVALALDARDETRQGMPGMELLTLRGNCGMRTTKRAMAGLTAAGLAKMTKPPAPGRRAVYEILPMAVDNPPTGDTMLSPEPGTEPKQRGPKTSQRGTPTVAPSQSLISSHSPQSSLSRAFGALRTSAPDITEREARHIIAKLQNDPGVRHPVPYLTAAVRNGDAAALVAEARDEIDKADEMRASMEQRQATYADAVCPDCKRSWRAGHTPGCPGATP